MKGVSVLYDESNGRRLIQIDLSEVEEGNDLVEDLVEMIVAESRWDDETISLEEMTAILKADGKL